MLKGAALVIALLGFTEKVPLVCEGTATLNGLGEKPASMSVIIDLDAGTMETNLGVLTIANVTDMELQLEKPSDSHSSFRSEIDAKFDLISGRLGVWDWRNNGLKQYDLTCTKAATLLWGNSVHRFPPPWRVEAIEAGFKVIDSNGQALAYVYGYANPRDAGVANALSLDEARRIASNIAKLP